MQELSMKWTGRALRLLGVEPRACEQNVNELRARVGVPNWVVQRGLIAQRARRAAVSTAMPLPRGVVWGALGWMRDLKNELHEHAFFSACVAYVRDPRFFDRPSWPSDLLHIMAPLPSDDDKHALVALSAGAAAMASARTGIRHFARRWTVSWFPTLALSLGGATLWGKIEAKLASAPVVDGVEKYLARATPRQREGAQIIHFTAPTAAQR